MYILFIAITRSHCSFEHARIQAPKTSTKVVMITTTLHKCKNFNLTWKRYIPFYFPVLFPLVFPWWCEKNHLMLLNKTKRNRKKNLAKKDFFSIYLFFSFSHDQVLLIHHNNKKQTLPNHIDLFWTSFNLKKKRNEKIIASEFVC